jgi:hypothetical protein
LASSRLPVIRSAIRATDPGNIEALSGTAFVDYTRCIAFLADNRAALLAAAEGASTLSLAPEHALAHHCLGCVRVASNRASQGMAG